MGDATRSVVVVVGAGLAGSTAAARAALLGCEVTLLDAASDATAGGNTARSSEAGYIGGLATALVFGYVSGTTLAAA